MRLPILMYHKVDDIPRGVRHPRNYVLPYQFDAQLAALRRWGYETISFDAWLAYRAGTGSLPRRPIIFTFDDGYRSFHDVAWPMLARHGFGATVFVVSGLVGATNRWDQDEVQEPLLDAGEIVKLRAQGVQFGSHGRSHRSLRSLTDAEVADELRGSREALERITGGPVRALCYPFGQANERVRAIAREAGYQVGVVWARRLNSRHTDPLRLARLWIDYRTGPAILRAMLLGLRLLP